MMKRKLRYLFTLALLAVVSCTKTDLTTPDPGAVQEAITLSAEETERLPLFESDYNRSHEEVLAIADNLMQQIVKDRQLVKTRSQAGRPILSDSIVIATPATRSATANVPEETKIYVVNFGEKASFTLIAADKRVLTPVLSYSESGDFRTDTDNPGAQLAVEYMQSYVQEEIARLEEMRGDSIYVALQHRYGFGAAKEPATENVATRARYDAPYYPMEGMPGGSPDNPYGTKQGSNWQVVSNGLTWYWAPVDRMVDAETPWYQEMLTLVYPMIPTQWGQDWPYNTEVKRVKGVPKTGCGPTAMAQIMAYHRKPAGYMWSSYGYNLLTNLNREYNYDFSWECKSSAVIDNIGKLLLDVGTISGAQYMPSLTGLYTADAAKGFRAMGYWCDYRNYYDQRLIEYSLTDKKPVYMSGARKDGGAHAWIVDGYGQKADYNMVYKNCYYQGEYVGYIKTASVNFTMDEYYYHCNWGWHGQDNGWYLAGMFNPPSHGNYEDYQYMIVEIQ